MVYGALTSIRATQGLESKGGKGHNGGVFEWTSSTLAPYDGFIPSKLYPGYERSREL